MLVLAPLQRVAENAVENVDVFKSRGWTTTMVEAKDATHLLDVLGFFCPVPVAEAKQALSNMNVGSVLQVLASDPKHSMISR